MWTFLSYPLLKVIPVSMRSWSQTKLTEVCQKLQHQNCSPSTAASLEGSERKHTGNTEGGRGGRGSRGRVGKTEAT